MLAEGLSVGGTLPGRIFGRNGAQANAVTDAFGRYVDAALRGNCYHASNLLGTPVTTQAGLSATTPALTLYNPVTSTVFLALYHVHILVTTSPGANVGFSLASNLITAAAPTSVTLATICNAFLPGGIKQGQGQCYRVATLAAAPLHVL